MEITIDGESIAFQLADVVQQQMKSLKEGDSVSFRYTVTKIAGKTIEEFILVEEGKRSLSKSLLDVEEEVADVPAKLRTAKDTELLKGMSPFEIFQLYMYTKAGISENR